MELTYQVHGVSLGIRCECPQTLEEFRRTQLPPDWRPTSASTAQHWFEMTKRDQGWQLLRNGEPLGQVGDVEQLYTTVGNHLHLCVAEFADPQVFLHAAV